MITFEQISKLNSKKKVLEFLEKQFSNDFKKFAFEVSGSLNTLLATDLKKAQKYLKKAETTFKYLPEDLRPRLLAMQGRLAHWSGNPKLALKKYNLSCKLFRKYGDKMTEMRTGVGLMDVHMYLGNYEQALKVGKASLSFFRKSKEPILAANTMINLGNVYHRLDKNNLALTYYEKARKAYSGKDKQRLAMAEYNRANIYANLFKLDKAKELYRRAAEIYKELGMEINRFKSEYSQTYLEFLSDNYAVALKQFEEIYDDFIRLGDIKSASVTQLDLVELHLHLNQFGAASMVAEELIGQFTKLGMNYEKGKAQFFAADASIKLGDYSKAAKLLSDAGRTFLKEQNSLWRGMVSNARARLYLRKRKFGLAEAEIRRALGYYASTGDERRTLDAKITQLESKFSSNPTSELLNQTRKFLAGPLASYQRFHLECLMGQHFLETNKFDNALKYCKSSINTLEKMLTGLYPDEVRYYFLEDKTSAFTSTVDCLLKMDRTTDGFVQNLQMMSAVNQHPAVRDKVKRVLSKDTDQKIKRMRASLKSLNTNAQIGQRSAESTLGYRRIEQKLWLSEQKLRSSTYTRSRAFTVRPEMLKSTTKQLPPGKVVLNYFSMDERIGVFCADKYNIRHIPLKAKGKDLKAIVRELDFCMENSIHNLDEQSNIDAANFYLDKLYDILVEPIKPFIGDNEIVLLVDGLFAQIPWLGLLRNSKHGKEDSTEFKIICNPLDLKNIDKRTKSFPDSSNAIFAVTSDSLPSVNVEADKISVNFKKAKVYKNKMAVTERLKDALDSSDGFVHIAAHSSRSSENPLFSRILMSDGPFFPFDLFNSGVRAQLVTLSGCQTAAPGLYYGNSFSLAKSFIQAGSRYVLASLWPVRDKEIMKFMNHFYTNLKTTNNVFESYYFAVRKAQNETENPAVWASFVLWGI